MMTRRHLLARTAMLGILAGIAATPFATPVFAQAGDPAVTFISQTAQQLTGVVNGPGGAAQKRQALAQIVDHSVDTTEVARFVLGQYWRRATAAQQQRYTELFREVLVKNVSQRVGEYQGVKIDVGRGASRQGGTAVSTMVTRPGNAPNRVEWLVNSDTGSPKIIDVIAEGTSLRLTQRDDYAAFLSRNGGNVQALIDAMQRQAG